MIGLPVGRGLHAAPLDRALQHVPVARSEHLRGQRPGEGVRDLLVRRPDVAEIDRVAVRARAERIGGEVDPHAAGERVRDDERGRGEIVGLDGRVDAPLEVAVARQHRGDDQVAGVDRGVDPVVDRAGVADARGAAVPDEVEAEPVEVGLQPGALRGSP